MTSRDSQSASDSSESERPVQWIAAKNLLAKLATHPLIGRGVSLLFKDVIPFHGGSVDLRNLYVPNENKASLFWGIYESAEYRFVRDYLSPTLPVIELGSSLGAIASVIARILHSDQKLICVEANPAFPQAIERTLRRNAPLLSATVVNAAIGYDDTHTDLHVSKNNLCSLVDDGAASSTVRVPCVMLVQLVSQLGSSDFQLVSDIEGAEAAILFRDGAALARCQTAILELHTTRHQGKTITPDDMVSRLRALGFENIVRYGPVVACRRTPYLIQ